MTQPDPLPKQSGQPLKKAGKKRRKGGRKSPRQQRKLRPYYPNPPPIKVPISEPEIYRHDLAVERWRIKTFRMGKELPSVMFMPGFGTTWRWWLPTMREVAETRSVAAIDLPGMGRSGKFGRTFPTPREIRKSMAEVANQILFRQDVDAIGHGIGGYILLQHLLQGGGGIHRALVIAPAGVAPHNRSIAKTSLAALYHGIAMFRPAKPLIQAIMLLAYAARGMPISRDLIARIRQDTHYRHNRSDLSYQLLHAGKLTPLKELIPPEQAAKMRDSVRIVWGAKDRVFPVQHAHELSEWLGGAPVSIYNDSGHWPHITEPQRFRNEMTAWMVSPAPEREPLDFSKPFNPKDYV